MKSGYEISYQEFLSLLSDPAWNVPVAPLLREWFGCEIDVRDGAPLLLGPGGVERDPHEVYSAIESNPDQQFTLYQTAMTLWR